MYAIFEDGSHQYRVSEGDEIIIDRRPNEPDDELVFDKVMLIAGAGTPLIGSPTVDGARVVGKVIKTVRGKKLIIQKFRRRKNHRRKNGHRQTHTRVQITSVVSPA
jgi:large subunit ribosomal protein L21